MRRMIANTKANNSKPRRLRYLTFCAEGAIDVLALRNAKIIKRSAAKEYDTVVFFDFAPQAVDRTLAIIEGANGFPTDFFNLVNLDYDHLPDSDQIGDMPRDKDETDATFKAEKNATLFTLFRESFPFDLINLDVERYVIRPSEQLPGHLLSAWDKVLDWQKRSRQHEKSQYSLDEFTLFFTTKLGPAELPEPHRSSLIDVLEENVTQFPGLKEILITNYASESAASLYATDFESFLKLAVPKALVSRALARDWILDLDLSYRGYKFDRSPPSSPAYTMMHYILHFKRCSPSIAAQINPHVLPAAIRVTYGNCVERIFVTPCEDVDVLKVPLEQELREGLAKLGAPAISE